MGRRIDGRTIVATVVTTVWAVSVLADIYIQSYEMPDLVGYAGLAVVGAYLGISGIGGVTISRKNGAQ